ncbi:MAG TPA: heavy metal-associated domain-containing protein [Clostridia bacterium]|nr:heavy metal-associated domain-containing protein [Clostridia bacterium]
MENTTFSVPSITCSVCSNKIQQGVSTLNGIGDVSVDLKSKTVNVQYDPADVQPQEIRKKIASLGYEVIQ